MRPPLVAFLLVLSAVAAVPLPAQAQDAGGQKVIEDNAGDLQVATPAGPQAAPAQVRPDLDLLGLTVQETPEAFVFTVAVTDVRPGDEGRGDDGAVIDVQFTHNQREFQARLFHQLPSVSDYAAASLSYRDAPDAPWNGVWWREDAAVLDGNANTYTITVPRADLADAKGAAPFPERTLEAFSVHSSNLLGDFGFGFLVARVDSPAPIVDHMPDTGTDPDKVAVQYGLRQLGHARLTSAEPFRASNGEATTFIFKAVAQNLGDEPDRFQLKATRLPTGWTVVLPTPTVDLEGGGSIEVPVVATQPFGHVHGATASFILQMVSQKDPEGRTVLGQLEMGARYLTIPQPAGHHDTLYLHSRSWNQLSPAFGAAFSGSDGYPFMNTLDQYEGDEAIPLSPQSGGMEVVDGKPVQRYRWCVPLDPGLQMGLDFKLGQKGNLTVKVHAIDPLTDATLAAQVLVVPDGSRGGCYWGNEPKVLASLNATQPVTINANSDGELSGQLDVHRFADRVPYIRGQNLLLYVEVTAFTGPDPLVGATAPKLNPGSTLQLPLLDYKDDIKEVLTTAAGPTLSPLGPQQRLANPGGTIVFPLSVANDGAADLVLGFNVTGPNSDWAQLPGGGAVAVSAHNTARADLLVKVPETAKAGDVADLVLQAFDQANQTSRGLVRLVVTVVVGEVVPDDAGQVVKADPPKKAPGLAVLGAVAGLGLVAAVRRRRLA